MVICKLLWWAGSEGIIPRVAFCSSKSVESIGPACFKPMLLPWIQIFLYPRGHLEMTGDVFSCHNWRQWKRYCHCNTVDRLGMHPKILQHTGTPSSLPNRELFGLKCQQWWDSEILNLMVGCGVGDWDSVNQFSCSIMSNSFCDPMNCSTPGLPVHHQFLEFTQTHVHWVGDAIQPSHSLLSPSPPAINLSQHQGLFHESAPLIRWPKYWSFNFNISPSNELPWLISFRMDSLDFLAVQGTLKSLLQHHSSKGTVLQCSAFFIVQLSHPYMTTGKTIALTRQTFVDKVMSLFFNMPSGWSQLLFQGVNIF